MKRVRRRRDARSVDARADARARRVVDVERRQRSRSTDARTLGRLDALSRDSPLGGGTRGVEAESAPEVGRSVSVGRSLGHSVGRSVDHGARGGVRARIAGEDDDVVVFRGKRARRARIWRARVERKRLAIDWEEREFWDARRRARGEPVGVVGVREFVRIEGEFYGVHAGEDAREFSWRE